jgi:hypothetical protein
MLNIHVTGVAEDERFSLVRGHDLNPAWFLSPCVLVQIFQCSDVMHLYLVCDASCSALFTGLS